MRVTNFEDSGRSMEPTTSTGIAGVAGWKMIGGLAGLGAIGAGLASIVVMCMMTPRDPKEWAIALISTVIASVCGGSAVVRYFEIQHWAHDQFGLMAMIGLIFACGLPGWAIVRWVFNSIRKRESAGIDDIYREIRQGVNGDS